MPPSPEIPKPEDGNEGSATALVSTDHHDGAVTGRQHGHDTRGGRLVEIPYNPKRVYNSFYQRETGHIFADPFGTGELENRGGVIVNLRDEREREEDRMERKGRDGVNGGGAIRRVR